MKCPSCGSEKSAVLQSYATAGRTRRRRKCLGCDHRWSTVEIAESELKQHVERTRVARKQAQKFLTLIEKQLADGARNRL